MLRAAGLWVERDTAMAPLGGVMVRRKLIDGAKGDALRVLLAAETRAAAGRLLALGFAGRVFARAARMAEGAGRRWLRRQSRREAASVAEVGAAAGVDDRGAWESWRVELIAEARAVFFRAASYGLAIASAPLAPCRALVARGLTGGAVANLRLAIVGRGRRLDCLPVVEWTEHGRQVRADSIGIVNRGLVWVWAGRMTARAAHALRYGAGGRDGREVWADWSFWGNVAAPSACFEAVAIGSPTRGAGSGRRAGMRAAMRAAVADMLREARARYQDKLAAAAWHESQGNNKRAYGLRGCASNALKRARANARHLVDCIDGRPLEPTTFERLFNASSMTGAGRMRASRLRDSLGVQATRKPIKRAAARVAAVMGDEVASAATIAPPPI
jgi:hypothetical protein